ncbi:MAG: transcriptional coactivator p15/PC4 family protein [Thermodesulfovibrionales bacterium]
MIIGEIERNETERLRVSAESYRGKDYLDIRIYYLEQSSGEWKPTKKGVTLAPEKIDEFSALISKAGGEFGKI